MVAVLRTAPGSPAAGVVSDTSNFGPQLKLSRTGRCRLRYRGHSSDCPRPVRKVISLRPRGRGFPCALLEGAPNPSVRCCLWELPVDVWSDAALGRILSPEADQPNAAPVVVMSGNFFWSADSLGSEKVGSVMPP